MEALGQEGVRGASRELGRTEIAGQAKDQLFRDEMHWQHRVEGGRTGRSRVRECWSE